MDVSTISWKFAFPETREDLLVSESGKFSVGKVVPVHTIPMNLDTVRDMVKKRARWSWWSIEYFDTFFSILLKFDSLDDSVKSAAWCAAIAGIQQHTETLAKLFTSERLDSQDKLAHLNAMKMGVYILIEMYKCFEDEGKSSHQIITTKKGKGKKNKECENMSWSSGERQEGVQVLRQLLDLNLALLFDPPVVHETFVEQIANCCYKLLENVEVPKCKNTSEYIFHVLGILIKRYNHSLGASMKIVQLLQQFEHLSYPFASLMLVCIRDYDVKSVVSMVIKEIGQTEPAELVRDTNATRNYCNFLMELGSTCGPAVLTALSSLMPNLDGDSYTMRNCVLTIIGDLISGVLAVENSEDKDTREALFDRLELHIHDQNAFVRSKSIQILTKLIEQRIVPIPRQHDIVEKVVGSIQDKSSNVRKNALVFITTYLGCNPYSDKFSLDNLKEKLKEESEKLAKLKEELPPQFLETGSQESVESEARDDTMTVDPNPDIQTKLEAVQKQNLIVQYLGDCVLFTEQMHRVIILVSQLLASKSTSDILESMDFLVSAHEFGLKAAELGVRKMLVLVFNTDQSVKDAVVSAYIRLYIKPASGKKCSPEEVARNLMSMTYGSTIGEQMSLKELVKLLLEREDISPRSVKVLLDILVDKDVPSYELNAAAVVLSMVASEDHTLVTQNINLLISAGFNGDCQLAKNTCTLLQQGVPSKKKKTEEQTRLEESHRLVFAITEKLLSSFDDPAVDWVGFGNEAVKTLFCLCEVPDNILTDLLHKMLLKTFPPRQGDLLDNMETGAAHNPLAGLHMYRLLSFLGQTALSTLVHLDTRVLDELKRRANVRALMEEGKREKKIDKARSGKRKSLNESTVVDASDDEMGLEGATADDTEIEHIRQVLEKEIVTGPGFLANFAPLLKHICSSPQLYPCHRIQNAAVLALCKFMLVSSDLCEDNIQLLFTLLEKSDDEKTRCNIMILLHDLIIRFPNLLVNWTGKIYARLSDESSKVRSTTIRVLTNLILNDMVKVKGNISELAGCLEDEDPRIRSLTKLFFAELSKKANAIYNVMADIISHLSDPDTGRDKDQFQRIMRHLFEFIEKDKQAESLVEKLCHRFRATRCDRQWHDLSFCLTLLPYNEKSVKKLIENIACYHDKVADLEVYENFTAIVEKARKTVKTEELLDDLEMKLRFCHNKAGGDDGDAPTDEIMSQMKNLLIKPLPPKQNKTKSRRKKKSSESDGEASPPPTTKTKRPQRISTKRRQPVSSDDDDDLELPTVINDEDEEEDFEVSLRSVKGGRKKPGEKTKAVPVTRETRRRNR